MFELVDINHIVPEEVQSQYNFYYMDADEICDDLSKLGEAQHLDTNAVSN